MREAIAIGRQRIVNHVDSHGCRRLAQTPVVYRFTQVITTQVQCTLPCHASGSTPVPVASDMSSGGADWRSKLTPVTACT